jgi:DNA polymerase-1
VLQGWLDNSRLQMDGRIGAGRTGIASTHRQKHKVLVNVPKASDKVLLGKEFRSLWIAEEGMLIAAGDAAALEGRVQGHYCHRYDGGVTARELLEGDVHSKNAFAFFADDVIIRTFNLHDPNFNKEDPKFKPFRDKSKNGLYATLYGCSAGKLASTLGLPESKGQELIDRFWDANPGTRDLKDAVEKYWEKRGKKKYLKAIDGRVLCTRKKSALLNTIFQSCGGIAMDYACCFLDAWLGGIKWKDRKPYYLYKGYIVRRIGYFHDEVEFECEEDIAEEVAHLIEKAIEKAGQKLKLNIELAGEGKVGKNWCEVH